MTASDVTRDFLAVIQISGMHCHRCEETIRDILAQHPGVFEVEVDFPSGQASVLYDDHSISVRQLVDSVKSAGYRALGFDQFAPQNMVA